MNGTNKELWTRFGIIQKNNKDLEFAACFACQKVYTFKKSTGTTTISKHDCAKDGGPMELYAMFGTAATSDKKKMQLQTFVQWI